MRFFPVLATTLAAATVCLLIILTSTAFPGHTVAASETIFPHPGTRDACPVCGMLVARYPAWIATVVYADGHVSQFDGAKDLFKYLFDLPRYAPDREAEQIKAIGVTEYYGLTRIAAEDAWFVVGSTILGPMGHELVPLASAADAAEFLADHNGAKILRFADITPAVISALD